MLLPSLAGDSSCEGSYLFIYYLIRQMTNSYPVHECFPKIHTAYITVYIIQEQAQTNTIS